MLCVRRVNTTINYDGKLIIFFVVKGGGVTADCKVVAALCVLAEELLCSGVFLRYKIHLIMWFEDFCSIGFRNFFRLGQ